MEIRIPRKSIAVLTSIVLLAGTAATVLFNYTHVSAEVETSAAEESKPESNNYETSFTGKEYENSAYWKADLSEYRDDFSLVTYETVEVPTEASTESATVPYQEYYIESYNYNDSEYQAIEIVPSGELITVLPDDSNIDSNNVSEYENNIDFVPENSGSNIVAEPGNFVFTTYGYGHGVGMSQNGANHYASYSGWNYQQILQNYYPGTTLQKDIIAEDAEISAGGVSGSVADIVSMVTYNEVGGMMHTEAIKAQAVAVYTYIMNSGGNADDLCPKSNPPQNVVDAVNSVLGEALYYNGTYALAMFSASSGGSTATCSDIFYQDIPYLRTVFCEYDSQFDPHYGTVEIISEEQVRADLETELGITLSDSPQNWISVTQGNGGYISYVTIDGQVTIKGNDFRHILGLKSPNFTFSYN